MIAHLFAYGPAWTAVAGGAFSWLFIRAARRESNDPKGAGQ